MIDFKCRPNKVRIFSVSENGEMDSVMKELRGQWPENFWARTAPDSMLMAMHTILWISKSSRIRGPQISHEL